MATPDINVLLPEFRKHIVLPGETLASLAQQNGITDPQYLRLFHNDCCQINELLGPEVTEGQVVYLPLQDEIININARAAIRKAEVIENARKAPLAPDRTLPFYPVKINNRYEVTIVLDTENIPREIRYVMDVKWLRHRDNVHILQFDQSAYLYNGEHPESKIDKLARQCAQSLFPLEIAIDNRCCFLGVANVPDIRTRWTDNKPHLMDYFSDPYSHSYIAAMDRSLHRVGAIPGMLQKNLFFAVFFPLLYETPFTHTLLAKQSNSIPIITNSPPVQFVIENTLEEYISTNNTIKVHQSGYAIDPRPLEDTYLKIEDTDPDNKGDERKSAFSTISYELDRHTLYIHKADAAYTVMLPDEEKNIRITIEKEIVV